MAGRAECAECGAEFTQYSGRHRFCSKPCKGRAQWRRVKADPERYGRERYKGHRRRQSATTDLTGADIAKIMVAAIHCPLCRARMVDSPGEYHPHKKHLDHIVPIHVGGTHTYVNVRVICAACNLGRPLDGSDYEGQLGLWSVGRGPGLPEGPRVRPFRSRLKGAAHRQRQRTRGARALRLRSSGMAWVDVAQRLGYLNTGGAYLAAREVVRHVPDLMLPYFNARRGTGGVRVDGTQAPLFVA